MNAAANNVHALPASSEIPKFEGEEVAFTKAKITSVGALEIGDRSFHIDQIVRLVVEARVDAVSHRTNDDGKLERVHTLKALDSYVVDWDLDLEKLK